MLFAVFCTEDIPAEILTKFISRSAEVDPLTDNSDNGGNDNEEPSWRPFIVTSSNKPFETYTSPATLPAQPFQTPFFDFSLSSLRAYFNTLAAQDETEERGVLTFIVLDQRSITEETCLCVTDTMPKETIRADLYMALSVLGEPEIGTGTFSEGWCAEIWNKGEVVTREGWKALRKRWKKESREKLARPKEALTQKKER